MKHVLFVIDTLRMGGAEKSLVSLLKALDPQRVNVDLFLFETGGVLQAEVPSWVNILEADPVTRGMTLELRNYLGDVIRSGHIGAAFSRLWMTVRARFNVRPQFSWSIVEKHIPALEKNYDAAIGYLEGFPDFFVLDKVKADEKIGWIHTDYTGRRPPREEAEYYSRFDKLVTISDVCKTAFTNVFSQPADKIQILENIVLTEDIQAKSKEMVTDVWPTSGVCNLVTVGRLDHHKGIDIAAKSAKILVERGVQICWHVYGQGIMKKNLEDFIQENGLEGKFVLEGLRDNPYPYMKRADLIVQPSRREGKSIVLDEAKILGKAIVVTDYPSVHDQITDQVTGLITGMEPEAIADGIERLLKDTALKKKLEENAAQEPNRSYRALDRFYELIEA